MLAGDDLRGLHKLSDEIGLNDQAGGALAGGAFLGDRGRGPKDDLAVFPSLLANRFTNLDKGGRGGAVANPLFFLLSMDGRLSCRDPRGESYRHYVTEPPQ